MSTSDAPAEDVLRRVRKLLALAESPNPNEAASAAAKARKILLEHGLTMEQIGNGPGEIKEGVWKRFPGAQRRTMIEILASIVASANMCRVSRTTTHCNHTITMIGRPAAVQVAKLQLDYLYEAMERGARNTSNGRGKAWMNDYRRGWIHAVAVRIEDAKKSDSVEECGLVLREDAALTEYIGNGKFREAPKPKLRDLDEVDRTAFALGHRDGKAVSLAQQLEA